MTVKTVNRKSYICYPPGYTPMSGMPYVKVYSKRQMHRVLMRMGAGSEAEVCRTIRFSDGTGTYIFGAEPPYIYNPRPES